MSDRKVKTVVSAAVVLSIFAGIIFFQLQREEHAVWVTKLHDLPPPIRAVLTDHFDYIKERRHTDPSFRWEPEEIITDVKERFCAGCSRSRGESRILFTKAIAAGDNWIIYYEYGGFAHGRARITLSPQAGSFAVSEPVYGTGNAAVSS